MNFFTGLKRARSHIVFLLGLAGAFTLIVHLDALGSKSLKSATSIFDIRPSKDAAPAESVGLLSPSERTAARIAWTYFENNYQPATGLVNSVDGYPSTTMWDQASYLLAVISAYRLKIIDEETFDERMRAALSALAVLPLFDEQLPNKAYSTLTLEMTDYNNNPTERGIGWSALDLGRLATPLNIIAWNYPQYVDDVKAILRHWRMEEMLEDGFMIGTRIDKNGETERVQEGRVGYEEYAASALALLAYDAKRAGEFADFLRFERINGVDVPTDVRDFRSYGAHNYVVSEPYILAGLEFGWTNDMQEMAYRVYAAQEARYEETGQLTAVSEDNIDRAPYFVYNTVFTNGKAWNAITEEGEDASEFKTISTKAAFGWDALYNNAYTDRLYEKVIGLYDPDKGFYSGWYEELGEPNTAITANSNGIILESLHYKMFGKLVAFYEE